MGTNTRGRKTLLIGLLAALLPCTAMSADKPAADDGKEDKKPQTSKPPSFVYQPPKRGAPKARIGGGTRSIRPLLALTPKHAALSSNAQPRLYWYIAPGFRNEMRFRLSPKGMEPPLLEIVLQPQPNGGIYYLDLAQHGVRLRGGQVYEWGLLLEPKPHQRWNKMYSGGQIELADPITAVDAAAPEIRPYLAARSGLWHDALEGVSRLIEQQPQNTPHWRLQRAELLQQVGLAEAAIYEREMLGAH